MVDRPDLRYGAYGAPSEWLYQDALNVEWPPDGVARVLRQRRPVPVMARIVWSDDGEEWVPGQAVKWVRPVVFVQVTDRRVRGFGLWLPADEVQRTGSADEEDRAF